MEARRADARRAEARRGEPRRAGPAAVPSRAEPALSNAVPAATPQRARPSSAAAQPPAPTAAPSQAAQGAPPRRPAPPPVDRLHRRLCPVLAVRWPAGAAAGHRGQRVRPSSRRRSGSAPSHCPHRAARSATATAWRSPRASTRTTSWSTSVTSGRSRRRRRRHASWRLILDLDRADLQSALTGTRRYAYVVRQVSPETAGKVKDAEVPGVYTERVSHRAYPADSVAGNIVGFAGVDNQGLFGIEQGTTPCSPGSPGQRTYWEAPSGAAIPTSSAREVGADQRLGRDPHDGSGPPVVCGAGGRCQGRGDRRGIRMRGRSRRQDRRDPRDGVHPDRRPQRPRGDPYPTIAGTRRSRSRTSPAPFRRCSPRRRCSTPGAVTVDTVFTVPDAIERSGEVIHNHSSHPPTQLTFAGIIAKSSNPGTILAAERMDKACCATTCPGSASASRSTSAFRARPRAPSERAVVGPHPRRRVRPEPDGQHRPDDLGLPDDRKRRRTGAAHPPQGDRRAGRHRHYAGAGRSAGS